MEYTTQILVSIITQLIILIKPVIFITITDTLLKMKQVKYT